MSYVCPDASSIPPEFCFEETMTSPGLLKARHIIAQSHIVPVLHIQLMSPHLFFNGDDMGIYRNWRGDGSCNGVLTNGRRMLVSTYSAANTSYNNHYSKDTDKELDGLKCRLTNSIAEGGGILPAWVQVLGFTDEQMPPSKVEHGVVVMKVPRLSASRNKDSHGYTVLVQKGVGVETTMFKMYEKHVVLPHVTQEWLRISRIDDRVDKVPDYLRAVLSTDGGQSQMKVLQDIK